MVIVCEMVQPPDVCPKTVYVVFTVGVTTSGLELLLLGSHVYVPTPMLAVRETVEPGQTDALEGVITKGTGVEELTVIPLPFIQVDPSVPTPAI